MRFILWFLLLVLSQPGNLSALTLAGTGDSESLLKRLATEYRQQYPARPAVDIPVSVGSSGGIRMLLEGRNDLARVARPLSDAEVRMGLQERTFALVAIEFVANLPQRCVADLDAEQIRQIFAGQIKRWSQLGSACPDQKIYLARREKGDSSNRVLNRVIPDIGEESPSTGKILYTTAETYQVIEKQPYSLGYLPTSEIRDTHLTRFAFNGTQASLAAVRTGEYPLVQKLGLAWKEPLLKEGRDFMHYLLLPEAQRIIREFGAVPVRAEGL